LPGSGHYSLQKEIQREIIMVGIFIFFLLSPLYAVTFGSLSNILWRELAIADIINIYRKKNVKVQAASLVIRP
jgi:hypothetical protein